MTKDELIQKLKEKRDKFGSKLETEEEVGTHPNIISQLKYDWAVNNDCILLLEIFNDISENESECEEIIRDHKIRIEGFAHILESLNINEPSYNESEFDYTIEASVTRLTAEIESYTRFLGMLEML